MGRAYSDLTPAEQELTRRIRESKRGPVVGIRAEIPVEDDMTLDAIAAQRFDGNRTAVIAAAISQYVNRMERYLTAS